MKLPAATRCESPLLSTYNSFPNSQAVSQDLQLKLPFHLGDGARLAVVCRRRIERKSNFAKRNGVVPVSCMLPRVRSVVRVVRVRPCAEDACHALATAPHV